MILDTNIYVNPAIEPVAYPTSSTKAWSKNLFRDPEDGVFFDESELTPLERGYIFLWVLKGDWYFIHSPFRVMDAESAQLVNNLRSFSSVPPLITEKKIPEPLMVNPVVCLQDFKLKKNDFDLFSSRVAGVGGIVEKDEVDFDDLIKSIKETSEEAKRSMEACVEQRRKVQEDGIRTKEVLDLALTTYNAVKTAHRGVQSDVAEYARLYAKMHAEGDNEANCVQADIEINALNEIIESLSKFDISRLCREAIHSYKVATGETEEGGRPGYLRSLAEEINMLKEHFSSLSMVSVDVTSADGEDVLIEFPGVTIRLKPKGGIAIEGDIASLKPYVGSDGSVKEKGAGRRRIIDTEKW